MSTRIGALIHSIEKKIPFKGKPFPSWKGAVINKQEVLLHSRFSIVYENKLVVDTWHVHCQINHNKPRQETGENKVCLE